MPDKTKHKGARGGERERGVILFVFCVFIFFLGGGGRGHLFPLFVVHLQEKPQPPTKQEKMGKQ